MCLDGDEILGMQWHSGYLVLGGGGSLGVESSYFLGEKRCGLGA